MPSWKNFRSICEHQMRVASFTLSSEWYANRFNNQLGCLLWNPTQNEKDDKKSTTRKTFKRNCKEFSTKTPHLANVTKTFSGNLNGKCGNILPAIMICYLMIIMNSRPGKNDLAKITVLTSKLTMPRVYIIMCK